MEPRYTENIQVKKNHEEFFLEKIDFFFWKIIKIKRIKWIKVQHLGYDQEFKPNKFDDHFTTNSHQKSKKTFIKNKNPRNVIFDF